MKQSKEYRLLSRAVLKYTSLGLKVFPCNRLTKRPATPNGFYDATSDPDVAMKMFNAAPFSSIGLVIPDDMVVVDIEDMRSLGGEFIFPRTVTAKTPRNDHSYHLWYRRPPGLDLKRKTKFREQLDILINGYVIAPFSRHPNGGRYVWTIPPAKSEWDNIPELPEDLQKAWVEYNNKASSVDTYNNKLNYDDVLYHLKEGNRQTQLFNLACSLRGKDIDISMAKVLLKTAASNATPPYTEKDTDEIVDRVWKTYSPNEVKRYHSPDPPVENSRVWKVSELIKTDIKEPTFFVESMLTVGFTLFSSDPKMGKSMILGNMCADIMSDNKVFGKLEYLPVGILYYDLEQEFDLAKKRWDRIIKDRPVVNDVLSTVFKLDPMDIGGLEEIENFIKVHPETRIIILDVLAAIWPTKDLVSGTAYQKDYAVISKLSMLAKKYNIAIIGVHHNTKSNMGNDFIKKASGSMGMTAASDTIWVLEKTRGSGLAKIQITGKNIQENSVILASYDESFRWYCAN